MADHLLVIDDEPAWLDILALSFTDAGWTVRTAAGGGEGLRLLSEMPFDVVLCDMAMADMDGLEVLRRTRALGCAVPFIVMTGVGTIPSAVGAMHLGAYDYITKPLRVADVISLAARAAAHGRMHRALGPSAQDPAAEKELPLLPGESRGFRDILATVSKVAASDVPVLIQGETGTGKSVLARRIHAVSARRDRPLLTIDCGALPESLLESELFGHVRGAFTGALQSRRGLVEEARGGTVFLDEIGELSPGMQAKLLGVLQDKVVRPVGGNTPIAVDVRFLAATNRNLRQAVRDGAFREDLFYRLAVVPVLLPPLRERREDILVFTGHFVRTFNAKYGKHIREVTPAALELLLNQPWPGNIRELANVLERVVLLADGPSITPADLGPLEAPPETPRTTPDAPAPARTPPAISLHQAVRDAEKKAVTLALTLTDGNRKQAAALLGVSRRTLYHKLKEYGLKQAEREAGPPEGE